MQWCYLQWRYPLLPAALPFSVSTAPIPGEDAPPCQPKIVHRDLHKICCGDPKQFGNSAIKLLGVIDLQNPKCIMRIKQNQLCYAEKSPTDYVSCSYCYIFTF